MSATRSNNRGFTLVEVLVAIIASSILAVLLMQMMTGHAGRSRWPLTQINQSLELREVMETINADYRRLLTVAEQPLVDLESAVDAGNYWAGQPYASQIDPPVTYCLNLNQSVGVSGEVNISDPCAATDTLLKVTISYGDHSLTALFSR